MNDSIINKMMDESYKGVLCETKTGDVIEFYPTEGDAKLRFRILDNEPKTELLLSMCKTKRIKPKDIHYAVKGIEEKLHKIDNDDFTEEILERAMNEFSTQLPKY